MKREIFNKLEDIFSEVFKRKIILSYDMTADDIHEWDSFSNIELILNIEEKFDIKFDLKELRNIENIESLVNYIENRIV